MKIYIRKIDSQCVTHQIAYTKEVLNEFLGDLSNHDVITCVGKNSKKEVDVEILTSTDDRFSNSIKNLLNEEGTLEENDLLMMYKTDSRKYIVELVKPTDQKYQTLLQLFNQNDRHLLLDIDNIDDSCNILIECNDNKISYDDFKEWLSKKTKSNGEPLSEEHIEGCSYILKTLPTAFDVQDIFELNSLEEFEIYDKKIREDDRFNNVNNALGKGLLSSGLTNFKEYITEKDKSILSVNTLVNELIKWCNEKPIESFVSPSLVGFGFKYAKSIITANLNGKDLLEKAQYDHPDSGPWIDKGVDLYKALNDGILGYKVELANIEGKRKKLVKNPRAGGDNVIYYGAPGCGKSYKVKQDLKHIEEINKFRVTFHPEYTNSDFVGQILPRIDKDENDKDIVRYEFNPGPFTKALERALTTEDPVYLVIEEINRGNAAAVFGDLFQLLDRQTAKTPNGDENIDYGRSEYDITNPNLEDYLKSTINLPNNFKIYIPRNMNIRATMNTSDQNVFTLDTAFKRRWSFEQISNEFTQEEKEKYGKLFVPGTNVSWVSFLTRVNEKILENKIRNNTNEDKQLGKYFVKESCLTEGEKKLSECGDQAYQFAYKILEYLWNDVCKIDKDEWFYTSKCETLEKQIHKFLNPDTNNNPLSIFKGIDFDK